MQKSEFNKFRENQGLQIATWIDKKNRLKESFLYTGTFESAISFLTELYGDEIQYIIDIMYLKGKDAPIIDYGYSDGQRHLVTSPKHPWRKA